MTFGSPEQEQIDGKPFTVIEGTWNKDFLGRLRGQDTKASDPLPNHVPDLVRVYFDENRFPHRILYLKRRSGKEIYRPMVTLDFLQIVLKASVDDAEFHFVPPKDELANDITNEYIKRFRSASASRKADAGAKQPEK